MTTPITRTLCALLGALTIGACGDAADAARMGPSGSRGVTQGGAQDIAHFRAIVDDGDVPRPDTLDPVGFFAEHAVDLPEADCGERVCVHEMLAVAPRFNGDDWTMAYVALNSPVDPATLERPDTHLVVAIEDTTRTAETLSARDEALRGLLNELRPGDRVSLLRFGAEVEVLSEAVAPTDPAVAEATAAWTGEAERAALYDALARAAELVEGTPALAGRVLLLTSGRADAGVTDAMRVEALAESLGRAGVGVSVTGVGADYRPELPQRLSEAGGGSYYYAQDAADLATVFTLEGRTSLSPLATDFELRLEPAPGYRVGRVFGARRAWSEQSAAHLASPVLMLGNRTGADDVDEGRRGGGGGLFVELIADDARGAEIGTGQPAFTVRASWTDAASGARVTHEETVVNELAPGEVPGGMWPFFSDPARGKAFMMINMYFALALSLELFHGGDCAGALGVEPMVEPSVDGWQAEYDDPDIAADWALLQQLTANVRAQCAAVEPVQPLDGGSVSCMFI